MYPVYFKKAAVVVVFLGGLRYLCFARYYSLYCHTWHRVNFKGGGGDMIPPKKIWGLAKIVDTISKKKSIIFFSIILKLFLSS
jgi:hypothetical protein